MTQLGPVDSFGRMHVVALALAGVDALADEIRSIARHRTRTTVDHDTVDEFDLALVGLCALGAHVRSIGTPASPTTATATTPAESGLCNPEAVLR